MKRVFRTDVLDRAFAQLDDVDSAGAEMPWYYCKFPEQQHDHLNRVLLVVAFLIGVPGAMIATPWIAGLILLFVQ